MATREEVRSALDFYADIGNGADDIYPYYHIRALAEEVERLTRELGRENSRLRNQIKNLLKPSRKKIAEQRDKLREALEFISETGGTTHETECGTITCTGFWCAEQARSALSAMPNVGSEGAEASGPDTSCGKQSASL